MILYFPTYPPGDSFWRWERQSSFNPDNKKSGEGVLWKLLLPTKHGQWCNFFCSDYCLYLKDWSALGNFFRLSIAGERFRGTCAGEGKPCRCVQTISMLLQILLMISLIFLILQVRPSNNKIIANIDDNISDIAGPPEPVTNGVDSLSLSLLSLSSIFTLLQVFSLSLIFSLVSIFSLSLIFSLSSRSMAEVFPGYQTLLPCHWFPSYSTHGCVKNVKLNAKMICCLTSDMTWPKRKD